MNEPCATGVLAGLSDGAEMLSHMNLFHNHASMPVMFTAPGAAPDLLTMRIAAARG